MRPTDVRGHGSLLSAKIFCFAPGTSWNTMTLAKNLAINSALNGLLFYGIGRKLRGHRTGVRLGLVGGILSGFAVWYIDTRSDDTSN